MNNLPIFNHVAYQFETTDFVNPAAGNHWNLTLADKHLRSILSMAWAFIPGAAAGNRYMQFLATSSAGGFKYIFQDPTPMVTGFVYQFAACASGPYVPCVPDNGVGLIPLPSELYIEDADSIHLIVMGILPADQLFAPCIQFKIWRSEP